MTITQKEEAIIEVPFARKSLIMFWYLIIIILCLLVIRVAWLDIAKGEHYAELSRGNRIRSISIKAPRGKIMDRFGNILVRNVPSIDVVVIPNDLPQDAGSKHRISEILSSLLNMDMGNVETALENQNKKSLDPILLKENISQDEALILSERAKDLPGISLENTATRNYEESAIFSTLIGYDGKITREELSKNEGYVMTDYIGKAGLEKYYEKELKGKNGARQVEVDSAGNVKKNVGIINPNPGSELVLNVDRGLQKIIYDSLSADLEKAGSRKGAAIAINPRNGGVLAMVSFPSYDNNLFARGISNDEYKNIITDKDLPLLNRVVNGEYPPGSTLKPVVAAAALSEGVIEPSTIIDGLGGSLTIGNFRFGDWKVHGPSDVRTAIAESNDIFFYTIGGGYGNIEGLGMSRMKKYENLFGFGSPTGIDFSGDSNGFIPDEQWKQSALKERWYIGDSYHAAIGQGFITATPLQLANYTAALANQGTLYVPRIVNKIKKSNGEETHIMPRILRKDFISPDVLKVVRDGMRQTVESGTAKSLGTLPVKVAGKTGTAQFGTEEKVHSWFISFAPYEDPEIAMLVLMEGIDENRGSSVSVTRSALEWYFQQNK